MPSTLSYRKQVFSAIFLVIIGYFGFNIADLLSKILQNHYSIHQVLATSSFLAFCISATWLKTRYGWKAFFPPNFKPHIIRALCICGVVYCMVSSLKLLSLADFYGIIFIMPFMVMIMSVLFLKEHVGIHRWAATIIAFTGILILAGPQFSSIGLGVVLALLGAFFSALNVVMLRVIGKNNPVPFYGVYPFFLLFLISITGLVLTDSFVPVRIQDLPLFALHGPAAFLGTTAISIGFTKAPETAMVAPFNYTQIIWGVLFGWLVFGNLPTTTTWIGLSFVIGAGLYSLWREYKISHRL